MLQKGSASQTPLTNLTLDFLKSCAILFAIWHASLSGSIPTIIDSLYFRDKPIELKPTDDPISSIFLGFKLISLETLSAV